MSDFRATKWYLDAADRCGNAYFGYWVVVQWKGLTLHYYQHLWHTRRSGVTQKSGLARQPSPGWSSDTDLRWDTVDIQGVWRAQDNEPIAETVLRNDQGQVYWQCLQPKALVTLHSAPLTFTGWGYTECIDITVPAWQLPWKTLYWGRAHSDHHCMVWIKWDGPLAQSLLWYDGKRSAALVISDTSIAGPEIELKVETTAMLRQGIIRSTLFGSFERLAALLPKNALLIEEQKRYGTGQILSAHGSEPASVIYERVLW